MRSKIISTTIVGMLVLSGLLGLFIVTDETSAAGPTYVSGPITSDITWYLTDSPFIVTGDIIVDNGTILTIEAGVTVKFDGLYSLIVNGTLNATGTTGQPILFTSNQSSPNTGDWHRVRLQGANNTMDYCEISYVTTRCILWVKIPTTTFRTARFSTILEMAYTLRRQRTTRSTIQQCLLAVVTVLLC